jgi:hypothetical protein
MAEQDMIFRLADALGGTALALHQAQALVAAGFGEKFLRTIEGARQ